MLLSIDKIPRFNTRKNERNCYFLKKTKSVKTHVIKESFQQFRFQNEPIVTFYKSAYWRKIDRLYLCQKAQRN